MSFFDEHPGRFCMVGILLSVLGFIAMTILPTYEANTGTNVMFVVSGVIVFIGIVSAGLGALKLYDSQEINYERIPDIPKMQLVSNQSWRKETGFRYLEELKAEYMRFVKDFRFSLKEAEKLRESALNAGGFLAFNSRLKWLNINLDTAKRSFNNATELEQQIEKVFCGDVRTDIRNMEDNLEKCELRIRHNREEKEEAERELSKAAEDEQKSRLKRKINFCKDTIKRLENQIISLRSRIKELKEFDYQKLYTELGVSPEAMRIESEGLEVIKLKTDIVNTINPQQKQKSPEEIRQEKLAKKKKEKRKFQLEKENVISNASLTKEEKMRKINFLDEKLAEIDKEIYEYM
jgi:chromosome segregation ATPase